MRLFGNLGGFEAPGIKIFQALPLADLALIQFTDYAGRLPQRLSLPFAAELTDEGRKKS